MIDFAQCYRSRSDSNVPRKMPNTPIEIEIPQACRDCGRVGTVHLQQTIRGARVILQWHCASCDAEWVVTRKEQVAPPQ